MAFTPVPLKEEGLGEGRGFSIEMLVRCDREPKQHLPSILVLCDRSKKAVVMVGQWKTSLIVRKFGESTIMGRRWKEMGVRDALPEGQARMVTITSGAEGTIIYLDGKPAKKHPLSLAPTTDMLGKHYLVLGNSPTSSAGWSGSLLGAALYGRSLEEKEVDQNFESWTRGGGGPKPGEKSLILRYKFEEGDGIRVIDMSGKGNHLLIPPHSVFARTMLAPVQIDLRNKGSLIQDVVINIAGFVPLGLFFPLWVGKMREFSNGLILLLSVLAGFMISIGIEVTQGFIPVRSSSQLDVICNTLGMVIGAVLSRQRGWKLGGQEARKPESG